MNLRPPLTPAHPLRRGRNLGYGSPSSLISEFARRASGGDEVILPSFAFIAAANALRYEHVVPVFADIDPRALNLDPGRLAQVSTRRTRAIRVVHPFGVPAAMNEIMQIARRSGLLVIEDACKALGTELGGGERWGPSGYRRLRPLSQQANHHGTRELPHEFAHYAEHDELGYNGRLSELYCALGVEQSSSSTSRQSLNSERRRV